jgi:hypothetical protein
MTFDKLQDSIWDTLFDAQLRVSYAPDPYKLAQELSRSINLLNTQLIDTAKMVAELERCQDGERPIPL